MKDRIKKLLIAGYKASDIASIVGCSPSYVSQLLHDGEFKAEVEAAMLAQQADDDEEVHLENRYQKIKHKILNNIEQSLPNAELPQLVRALEVVDKVEDNTKRRKLPAPVSPTNIGSIHITQIALPAHALEAPKPVVTVNEKNEIIAIDARPLAPMSSDGVKNIFSQIMEKRKLVSAEATKVIEQL